MNLEISSFLNSLEDDQLAEAAQGGDKQAFSLLVQRHYRSCLRVAIVFSRSEADAQDHVQTAVLRAFERLHQYRCQSAFSKWLISIVVNQCRTELRAARRQREYATKAASQPASAVCRASFSDTPESAFARGQASDLIRFHIGRVPPLLRVPLVMSDMQQVPLEDVATRLGITVAAAKSRLFRARAELRRRLEEHCRISRPHMLLSN